MLHAEEPNSFMAEAQDPVDGQTLCISIGNAAMVIFSKLRPATAIVLKAQSSGQTYALLKSQGRAIACLSKNPTSVRRLNQRRPRKAGSSNSRWSVWAQIKEENRTPNTELDPSQSPLNESSSAKIMHLEDLVSLDIRFKLTLKFASVSPLGIYQVFAE